MNKKYLWTLIPGIIFTLISLVCLGFGTYFIISALVMNNAESVGEAVGIVVGITLLCSLSVYAYIGAIIFAIIGVPTLIDGIIKCRQK